MKYIKIPLHVLFGLLRNIELVHLKMLFYGLLMGSVIFALVWNNYYSDGILTERPFRLLCQPIVE